DVLKKLSPMPERTIWEEERRVLHRTPQLTDEQIHDLCDALLIRYEDWPATWPRGQFTAYQYTVPVLDELSRLVPLVTLSNLGVIYGSSRMRDVVDQCGAFLTAMYTSYELRCRKPARWLWRHIADRHNVRPSDIVHV